MANLRLNNEGKLVETIPAPIVFDIEVTYTKSQLQDLISSAQAKIAGLQAELTRFTDLLVQANTLGAKEK